MVTALDAEELRRLAGAVPDPELPVLTLEELGVLRSVRVAGEGRVEVELTPTYTGCPAIESMAVDVERVLREHGCADVTVRTVLSPAWTTDWISAEGRRKLAEFGIAPPGPAADRAGRAGNADLPGRPGRPGPVFVDLSEVAVRCPHCGSPDTRLLSRFASTACKALRSCRTCGEPFEHLKEL